MPKHYRNNSKAALAVFIMSVPLTVAAVLYVAKVLSVDHYRQSRECGSKPSRVHLVVIKDSQVQTPPHFNAQVCDKLTIINKDDNGRLMAFGEHNDHATVDGVSERYLIKNESFTVRLTKTGNFKVHDHNDESVGSTFTVKP